MKLQLNSLFTSVSNTYSFKIYLSVCLIRYQNSGGMCGRAEERRQEVENDTQGSTIRVDVSPTRSIATPSAPQESTVSSEPTTLILRTPSDSELADSRPPTPWNSSYADLTKLNSSCIRGRTGQGKRKRRHTKRCNEAVEEGILKRAF